MNKKLDVIKIVMKKKVILIILLILFIGIVFSVDSPELCTAAPCIVSKDNGVLSGFIISPNLDINFINTTIHLGQATHDFDLNFSLRDPDGNFLFKEVSATKADKNGLWFFEIIGGLSTVGDYIVIWEAEHLQNSIPDGNFDTETWQIEIIPADPLATGTGGCEIDLQTDFYLNQYLQITYSGFDVNGTALGSANFDLFRGEEQLIFNQNLTQTGDIFTFTSSKKINDDPYHLVITSGDCVSSKILQSFLS